VVHRANIVRISAMIDLALGASRIEIVHVQYYGWAPWSVMQHVLSYVLA